MALVTLDVSRGEAHGLIQALEYYAEHASREYLSPPTGDSPGERIDILDLLVKVVNACTETFD